VRYLLLITLAVATPCLAQYKCVENGRTTYADRPCSPGAKPVDLPRDNPVTAAEREQAGERLKRQQKVAAEIDTMNAVEQARLQKIANAAAAQDARKKARCAELLKTAKGAQDEAQTYRYHQGLIDDANRRKREAEAAHFSECYGTVR
jgi:hypothetical protein